MNSQENLLEFSKAVFSYLSAVVSLLFKPFIITPPKEAIPDKSTPTALFCLFLINCSAISVFFLGNKAGITF